ncbi:MAG: hypothetical protein KF878_12375 [Planctomycetes bacterium]|nr:hypothetical protein [Planctomycetota bacterium]
MAEPRAGEGTEGAAPGAEAGGIGSVLYKLALAGVGALILAQEELEAAWKRTRRERGEDGAEAPEEQRDGAAEAPAAAPGDPPRPDGTTVRSQIDAAIGRVLRTLPIPSREEVDQVAARLDDLEAKADAAGR